MLRSSFEAGRALTIRADKERISRYHKPCAWVKDCQKLLTFLILKRRYGRIVGGRERKKKKTHVWRDRSIPDAVLDTGHDTSFNSFPKPSKMRYYDLLSSEVGARAHKDREIWPRSHRETKARLEHSSPKSRNCTSMTPSILTIEHFILRFSYVQNSILGTEDTGHQCVYKSSLLSKSLQCNGKYHHSHSSGRGNDLCQKNF